MKYPFVLFLVLGLVVVTTVCTIIIVFLTFLYYCATYRSFVPRTYLVVVVFVRTSIIINAMIKDVLRVPSRDLLPATCLMAALGSRCSGGSSIFESMGVTITISTHKQQCFAGDVVEGIVQVDVTSVSFNHVIC